VTWGHPTPRTSSQKPVTNLRNQLHMWAPAVPHTPDVFGARGVLAKKPVTYLFHCQTSSKILTYCIMKFDTLHFALLAVVVLLAVYVARGYGLFREGLVTKLYANGEGGCVSPHVVYTCNC